MVIDTSKLKVSTKGMVALFMMFGGLMQIPTVSQMVLAIAAQHKNLAAIVTALMGIYTALHNPEVQDALGIKHTVETKETTEEVTVAKGAQ